jgi:hypothetical protein
LFSEEVFQNSFPEIDADHIRSAHQQICTFLRDSIEVSQYKISKRENDFVNVSNEFNRDDPLLSFFFVFTSYHSFYEPY